MSPFVAAASAALQEYPLVNAVIDDDHIVYRDYVSAAAQRTARARRIPCEGGTRPGRWLGERGLQTLLRIAAASLPTARGPHRRAWFAAVCVG
eukprot:269663-Prymnesium_polylepis.2